MFDKILVANRGEIALRIINTCKELGIKTVAVYSTADKNSLHVKFADEAVCIGPGSSSLSYLNIPNIIAAAEITNSNAIHPGYGFLSENAKFSKICEDNDIKFIGASETMIELMGNKAKAKETMKKAGVPVIEGSDGVISNISEAKKIAKKIGYPVMLKASAGGGGKGMRYILKEKELDNAWEHAKSEAKSSFGDDSMYMEKLILNPRHIEIQVLGDSHGNAIHLSERDCSIQRRHQKLTEETPSPFMTTKLREEMGKAAIKGVKAINYEGAGTIEFLVDKYGKFYFMEMNTRIQVEHPITEEVTGIDLIKQQILIATGEKIAKKNMIPKCHSIECRINAEDPLNNFLPSPGTISSLHKPGGYGVRIDTHIYTDYVIPTNYDSMIAKLIVTAPSRLEAIEKMKRCLDEFLIGGIKTTIPFHRKLMDDPKYISGNYDTSFMNDFEI